jgi:hypothetical protein
MVTSENKRRDKAQAEAGEVISNEPSSARILAGLQDETDKRNPYFRYLG